MELSTLIKKIGHPLVEIRERALKNIVFKLEHALITVPDLAQEKMLFVSLLEWFNFPEVPTPGEVMGLLNVLAKHPTAAQLLREVGAVEFLSQLRPSVAPELQPSVDGILDRLFQLPELPPDCPQAFDQGQELAAAENKVLLEQIEEVSPMMGYFQKSSRDTRQSAIAPHTIAVGDAVKCLKFSTFPWLALTTTDRHILSSNESSLRSNNHSLVRTTCELLQDVIMQDFPAEIFLQRPKIVQNLLSLLKLNGGRGSSVYLTLQAIACLQQLCTNLRSRLHFYRDPSFLSAKQDSVSQNSSVSYSQEMRGTQASRNPSPEDSSPRPSVIGRTVQRARGDGQDGDAASSSGSSSHRDTDPRLPAQSPFDTAHLELPEMESEDVLELQFLQLSLAQFCVAVIEHALPLLRTESMKTFLRVLELLSEVMPLLKDCISEQIWDDNSLIGLELKEKLLASMDCLGDILSHHQEAGYADQVDPVIVHHRMAYIGTAIFTIRLLQTLLPVEKVSENLPESTGAALFLLSMDMPFSMAFPGIHESATAYLEQASSENYCTYKKVIRAAQWMESTCIFLKEVKAEGEKNWLELIELADQAVEGFPCHQHLAVVKEFIGICSYIWKSAQSSPRLQTESQKVFLKLLSHPLPSVKTETYSCTLHLVKDCLGIQNVTKPVSSICEGVCFLLHPRILYEICTFGLQDQEQKVNGAAKEILLFLLKGQLMMTTLTWNKFTEALCPVVPVLQGYADTEDTLGNCVLLISEAPTETKDGMFPNSVRIRAAIRLLFSKQQKVRATAVKHLMCHLMSGEGAGTRRPLLDSALQSALASLYIVNKSVDIRLDDTEKSFFKVDAVNKLYNILTSETVDLVLRKSAAEQLALILHDTTLHAVLKSLGVTEKVISFINECVHNGVKSMDCLLESCFTILRKLVYADPGLRHCLAQKASVLMMLLRASLIVKENSGDLAEPAALMCLLLFDEVARMDIWTEDSAVSGNCTPSFSIPVSVVRRYNLPFEAVSHHLVSPYRTVLPLQSDLVALAPAWRLLQFAWNRAWFGGVDNLLAQLESHRTGFTEFLDDLNLSLAQVLMLKVTHVCSDLQDCLHCIHSALSHSAVSSALARIRFHLLTDRLALRQGSLSTKNVLKTLEWHTAIDRFLQVLPACTEDEKLLVDVVVFLNKLFKEQKSETNGDDLQWILELILKLETNTILNLLLRPESQAQGEIEEIQAIISQKLQKELMSFFNTLLNCLTCVSDRVCLTLAGPFKTQLALKLLHCLRLSDAPRFYGLPSLERTLRTMVHVTVLPGWSSHSPLLDPGSLCAKYLTGLLEVISSFYVQLGGNAMSFMGKGVTKNAVLCLLHLSHEMMRETKNQEWVSLWSLADDQSAEEQAGSRLGLAWLIPLWVDRDPEVRFASLGIGSALTTVDCGCFGLSASCQNISGGLWGTLLNILLDRMECSMVRREAAFIIQNLLVMPMPANSEESKDFAWQSPCVHDEDSGVSLVGLPALHALLYHCQFFEHASQMAKSCYQGRHSFDLNISRAPSDLVASITDDFEDSMKYWRGLSSMSNQSHVSSSLSTSSTLILPEGTTGVQTSVLSSSRAPDPDTPVSRLMAQGQSDTDTTDSLSSQDSRMLEQSSDHCGIVTPHLISAICGLLTNLLTVLPEFTLNAIEQNQILVSLASLTDAGIVERCFWELRSLTLLPSDVEDIKNQVLSHFQYLSSFSKLLQSALLVNPDLVSLKDFISPLLTNLFAVLTLNLKDTDDGLKSAAYHTWVDLFMLLTTLLKKNGDAALLTVTALLGKQWKSFAVTISTCVQLSSTYSSLYTSALQFLSLVLSEETKQQMQNTAPRTPLTQVLNGPSGSQLCEVLLQSFEKTAFEDVLKKVSASTLMALLASSPSAQQHALKAGFVESSVEQMKHIHAQLSLESLKPGKTSQRKKEESSMKELKMILQLLRNCLYRCDECKTAATDSRLALVVHGLWPWLFLDDAAMEAALELLCVYTANCTAACRSLCWSSAAQNTLSRGPACSSLMHSVMKLASQKAPESSSVQSLAFALLANLAMSHDCKGVLQKSNFLQNCRSLSIPKPGSKSASPVLHLWLKLLLNMSFGEDGQQIILKSNGALELLTEMSQYKPRNTKPVALLILHNLCFSSATKAKVLANDKAVRVLASCLESNLTEVKTIGASALWALLHNCQKAKVALKNPSTKCKVDEAYISAKKETAKTSDEPLISYLLKCLENLSNLLNS
ncbi:rotatin [Lepisosteus oculatus]|uniref:rotatin n=1 Tax=Lepisosteus oculatus TaxID=7918 RepID=UPI003717A30B